MKTHMIVLNFCLVITIGCLGIAYILGGYWLIVPVLLAMAILWMATKGRSEFWSASSLLLIYVLLAVIGLTLNLSIYLMVLGSTTALACWDLIHFRQSIADNPPLEADAQLESYRLQSLGTAVLAGLLLAFISSFVNR